MKQRRKRMTIIMLLIMIGNFYFSTLMPVVDALSSGEVYNYIALIKTNITSIENKVTTSESDLLYDSDDSYKESVIYISNEVNDIKDELEETEELLDNGVSLSSLINNKFSTKKTIYETYFINDTTVIDVNNIKDINYLYYEDDDLETSLTGTLLTKEEIETAIKDHYLSDLYDKAVDLNNNYSLKLVIYQFQYNGMISSINNYVTFLNTKKTEISTYEEDELLLNNVPNMIVNDSSIYDLIDKHILNLNNLKEGITISNIPDKTTEMNGIYNNCIANIDTFNNNNKSYLELGLDTDIHTFNIKINEIDTNLNTIFTDINIFKNSTIGSYPTTILPILKDIINLEKEYEKLITKINNYLERKPSDATNVNILLENINIKREYINSSKALVDITSMVDDADLTDEDVIDSFNLIKDVATAETKEKLVNAKINLYPLSVSNTANYEIEINKEFFILKKMRNAIIPTDLLTDLTIANGGSIGVFGSSFDDCNLYLFDKNRNEIKILKVIIQGDMNNNSKIDSEDVTLLKELLQTNGSISNKNILDIDGNDIVDIKDISLLDNYVNDKLYDGITTNAKLKVERKENTDNICYDVKLETNGTIKGLSFNINHSDNLLFDGEKDLTNYTDLNDYNNDASIITLCYKEDLEKDLSKESLTLFNIKIVLDSGIVVTVDNLTLTTNKVIEKTDDNRIYNNNNSNSNNIINNDNNSEEEPEEPKEEENDTVKEEEQKREIIWSNVIKVIAIVILGGLIIYFLNKQDNDDEPILDDKKNTSN